VRSRTRGTAAFGLYGGGSIRPDEHPLRYGQSEHADMDYARAGTICVRSNRGSGRAIRVSCLSAGDSVLAKRKCAEKRNLSILLFWWTSHDGEGWSMGRGDV